MSILIVVCLLAAVAAGLLANRWVRPFAKSEVQGVKLEALVSPMVSLSVLVLAFVLVQTFASYGRARDSSGEEARKVDFLFETAAYAPATGGARAPGGGRLLRARAQGAGMADHGRRNHGLRGKCVDGRDAPGLRGAHR